MEDRLISNEAPPRPDAATGYGIEWRSLGRRPFRDVWVEQRALQRLLIEGVGAQTVLCCEHDPVITYGKSGGMRSLKTAETDLAQNGVEVIEVERGGDMTYHGPGQLVIYPILDLRRYKTDVGWYMRVLEESVIQTLSAFSVSAFRTPGKTGVWISEQQKISSLGVKISRWCTLHGAALNIGVESEQGFSNFVPCGLSDVEMISIERATGARPAAEEVEAVWRDRFLQVLSATTSFGTLNNRSN